MKPSRPKTDLSPSTQLRKVVFRGALKNTFLCALLLVTLPWSVVHGATIIWTNVSGGSWSTAANWSPNQVPGSADNAAVTNTGNYAVNVTAAATIKGLALGASTGNQTLVIASVTLTINDPAVVGPSGALNLEGGVVTAASPLTLNGVLNWSAGSFTGQLTVTSNGVVNLFSGSGKDMNGTLTNAGTVRMSGGSFRPIQNNRVVNQAGALWDIQDDSAMGAYWGGESFRNEGVLRKSGGGGTTTFAPILVNLGAVEVLSGTLQFNGGGQLDGTFNAATNTAISFNGGTFTYTPPSHFEGPGQYRLTGGTLAGLNEVIPNLQLLGGTVTLTPTFQGGVITNLSVNGTTLSGSNHVAGVLTVGNSTVSGPLTLDTGATLNTWGTLSGPVVVSPGAVFNWYAGTVGTWLWVQSNGVANLLGGTGKDMNGTLTNAGTVRMSGGSFRPIQNNRVVNQAGALWDLQDDSAMGAYWGGESFRNEGVLRKSGGGGTTTFAPILINLGAVEVLSGTLRFGGSFDFGGGMLRFGLNSSNSIGRMNVTGVANLGGGVAATLLNGYLPTVGARFDVMTFGSTNGTFTDYSGLDVGSGRVFTPLLSSTKLTLEAASTSFVVVPPTIVNQPVAQTGNHSGSATFQVVVAGSPELSYLWMRNGNPVAWATNSILTLTNLQFTDAGNYTVGVTNAGGGVVSQPVALTVVPVSPGFVLHPTNQTVWTGSNVNFRAVASGSPVPVLQWQRNGTNLVEGGRISGSATTNLSISNVQASDVGIYTAVASNVGGSAVSQGAVLAIVVVPSITSQPQSQTVMSGTNAMFAVSATGTEPLRFQWRFNDTDLAGATSSNLLLPHVQTTDGGSYTAVVSNNYGAVTSQVAMLTVLLPPCVPPPDGLIAWWPAEGSGEDLMGTNAVTLLNGAHFAPGVAGQAFSFNGVNQGSASSGASLTEISNTFTMEFWAFPTASRATTSEGSSGITGISLQRYAIYPEHGGTGGSKAGAGVSVGTNGVSIFEHADNYLPSLLVYDTPIRGWAHIAVVYQDRLPRLYLNGTLVRTGVTSLRPSAYPSKTFGDTETYGPYAGLLDEVAIFNRALSANEIAALYAAGGAGMCRSAAPVIIRQPANQIVAASNDAVFEVVAAGSPPLSYQWFFNSAPLLAATNTTLALPLVTPQEAGDYFVVVNNSFGSVTSRVAVLTLMPDLAVTQILAPSTAFAGQALNVSWTMTNQGPGVAGANWQDRLYLSTNATLDASAILLATVSAATASPLAAGANYSLTQTVTLPNVPIGNYFIIVEADIMSAQLESNEANNSGATAIEVRAPDLQIVNLAVAPASLVSGGPVTVRWDATNSGNHATSGSWYDRLTIRNATTSQTLLDTVIYYDANVGGPLTNGQSRARQHTFRLPDGMNGAGNLTFTVTADTYNQVAEHNASGTGEGNNTGLLSRTSTLAAYPDLGVAVFTVSPPTFESGRQITADWALTNLGTAAVTGDFYDRLLVRNLSLGTTIFDQSFYLNPPADPEGAIAVGQSRQRTAKFKLPDGTSGVGDIEVALFLDSGNRIFEFREGVDAEANNHTNILRNSTIALYPDLAVSNVTAPATGLPGQPINVSWRVANNGTAAAPGPWTDQVFLMDDANPNAAQLLGIFAFNAPLAVGLSSNVTRAVTLPFFTVNTRRLAVRANAGQDFYESDVTNNYRLSASTIALSPRLELTLNRASVPESGGTNSVFATVLRNSATTGDLTVTLTSSDTNSVELPSTVVISAGQTYRTFAVAVRDNGLVESDRIVTLGAGAVGFDSATVPLLVEDDDLPSLSLRLTPGEVQEDAGPGAAIGHLTRNTSTNDPVMVTVVSDSPTQLLPPGTVVIPAGQRSVAFDIIAPLNTTIEGARTVRLQASALGFRTGSAILVVIDNDAPTLHLELAAGAITEGAESPATTGRLTRQPPFTFPLTAVLQQSLPGLLSLPVELNFAAGQGEALFNVNVTDDQLVNGTRVTEVMARILGANGTPITNGQAVATLSVYDNDGPTLTMALAGEVVLESGSINGTVTRNTGTTGALVVILASSKPTEAVPATTTVTIPNGQSSANFTINGVTDGVNDGVQTVIITTAASGFNSATTRLNVSDIDLPDLAVGDIIVPSSGQIDAKANVTFTVANTSSVAANGPWTDRIYISTDNQLGGDILAGAITNVVPLAPNSSYARTVSITLPPDPALYHIIVVTDADEQVLEGSERNNVISVATIDVQPNYRATVETDLVAAPCGTAVPIHGRAFNPDDDSPARFKWVTVRLLNGGTRRLYDAFTDLNGLFQVLFTPLPTEVGDYQLAADHPRVTKDTPQDSFSLLGFSVSEKTATMTIVPETELRGQITLRNLTGVPLTGITAAATNAPASLGLTLNVSASLAGGASGTLDWSLNTTITNAARVVFPIDIASAEGCRQRILFTVNIAPLRPLLVAEPAFLDRGMVRGGQTLVPFTVRNVGGVASGPVEILPPAVSWMKIAGTNQLASLEPGGSTTVNVLLEPPADMPLLIYNGAIGLGNGRVGLALPYRLRAMSTAVGDLVITATDDYTYYVAGSPKLTNAVVKVSDPFTGQTVTNGVTDAAGEVRFVGLTEGAYTVDVTAPKHSTFRGTATIQPGVETALEAFLIRQTVTYRWSVVPVEVEDRYRVVLESVFETEVPVPNVIIEEPFLMPLVFEGEATQVEIVLRNEGLIAAENVKLLLPTDHPQWLIEALVTDIGTVPARSRLEIPVLISRRPQGALPQQAGLQSRLHGEPFDPNCSLDKLNECLPGLKLGVVNSYRCGPNGVEQSRFADISPVCLAKDVKKCVESAWKSAGSAASVVQKVKNLPGAGCDFADAVRVCAGVKLGKCTVALLSAGCKTLAGAITGGAAGAAGGAGGAAGSNKTLECLCSLAKGISISLPSAEPDYGDVNYIEGSIIGAHPSGFNGYPWSAGYAIGPVNCANSSPAGLQSARVRPGQSGGGVCARVRIQIDQEAVLTRVAFKGSLEIDNDSTAAITGIRVSLDVRDSDGNPAGDRFVVRPAVVTGMGDVDGTGVVNGFGTGSAEYLFIPTRDAAPNAPTVYRIGGSLRYLDNGQEVVVPLLSSTITVYPEARLQLRYFQSRNVYSDDPFTDEIEPAEPFALGLIAKNIGAGAARNFRITSAQPKIIENEKGLLIDFKIIGSRVGTNPAQPSLTLNLGTIPPGRSQVAQWLLTSSLQGKFIEYKATFEHVDNFGSTNLSLIDSVEIHELIKPVLADRLGDDLAPDFLVNDIPDPDSLPDVLYQSDGSSALVEPLTAGTFSNAIGSGARQTTLTFTAPAGWVYVRLPDPGPGWELHRVLRSDNKALKVGTNVWTTDRTFPSAISGVLRRHEFHLFDHNSTGSYTLFYRPVDTVPPTLVSVGPVVPSLQMAAVNAIDVVFSEEMDAATFSATAVALTLNGGPNLIGTGVTFTQTATNRFVTGGLAPLTGTDGNYELTVSATGLEDFGGNAGLGALSTRWAKGTLAPVITALGPVLPNPRNTPVDTVEVAFSRSISALTFGLEDLTLTRNGGANLVTAVVQVSQIETNRFLITGLNSLTQTSGEYLLTVNAAGVEDSVGTPGTGMLTASWSMITSGPQIVLLEHLATNPRNIVVASLDVTFAAPIHPATLTWQDLTLTRNGGPNLITSAVTVRPVSPTVYRIANFNWVVGQEGAYTLTVNAAGIADPAGNAGTGAASESWVMDTTRPPAPTALALRPDLGISNSDELINSLTPMLSGKLAETNLTARVKDLTTGVDLGSLDVVGQTFSKLLSLGAAGAHQLQIRSVDAAGNTGFPDALLDVFVDLSQPSAEVAPVTPALRNTPVNTINVTFSELINPATFTREDLTLRRQGGANLINAGVQIVNVISNEYRITGLTALTDVAGTYRFTLDIGSIEDRAGNTGTNTVSVSWSRTGSNQPPTLAFIPDRSVSVGESIRFTNSVSDLDAGQTLTFSLNVDAPANARIEEHSACKIHSGLVGRKFWRKISRERWFECW